MSDAPALGCPLPQTISSHTSRDAWITLQILCRPISRRTVGAAPPIERPKQRCRSCVDTSRGGRSSSSQPLPCCKQVQIRSIRPPAPSPAGPTHPSSRLASSHRTWSKVGCPRRSRLTPLTQAPLRRSGVHLQGRSRMGSRPIMLDDRLGRVSPGQAPRAHARVPAPLCRRSECRKRVGVVLEDGAWAVAEAREGPTALGRIAGGPISAAARSGGEGGTLDPLRGLGEAATETQSSERLLGRAEAGADRLGGM